MNIWDRLILMPDKGMCHVWINATCYNAFSLPFYLPPAYWLLFNKTLYLIEDVYGLISVAHLIACLHTAPSGSDSCLATMANGRTKVLLLTEPVSLSLSLSLAHRHVLSHSLARCLLSFSFTYCHCLSLTHCWSVTRPLCSSSARNQWVSLASIRRSTATEKLSHTVVVSQSAKAV